MDTDIIKLKNKYFLYMKRRDDFVITKIPLLSTKINRSNKINLQILRDLEFIFLGKNNEKVIFGLIQVNSNGTKNLSKFVKDSANTNYDGISKIFEDEFDIKIINIKKIFDKMIGEIKINIDSNTNLFLRAISQQESKNEYLISNPLIEINNDRII